jgi:hyperosmotically inducible protein
MRRATISRIVLGAILACSMVACTSMPRQQPPEEAIEDGVVTARVKEKLIADPVTKSHNINVETFKGTVQLSGFVESNEARARALQLAREVEGVKRVRDAMDVPEKGS